jgi:hypothetical protein
MNGPILTAAKKLLTDAGFHKDASIFSRRVTEGLIKLATLFDEQNYSVMCGRLVASLFSRIARGSPPNISFLKEMWAEIEKVAEEDFPYNEKEEEKRWIGQRYPSLHWAGDLIEHVRDMALPLKKDVVRFNGAPLCRSSWDNCLVLSPMTPVKKHKDLIAKDEQSLLNNGTLSTTVYPDNVAKANEKEEKNMCMNATALETKVVETVKEFCHDMVSFTSLDISNKVKTRGFVARHREIAELVRTTFVNGTMDTYGFKRDLINVTVTGGMIVQTYLYHHVTVPIDDYKNRTQVALKPSRQSPVTSTLVSKTPVLPQLPSTPVYTSPVTPPSLTHMLNTSSVTRSQKGDGRLEIPRVWLNSLGWQVGDTVSAIRDGNSLVLKTSVQFGDNVVKSFVVDRWNRIRITTRVLNEAGLHLGSGGQHVMTLRTGDIKID